MKPTTVTFYSRDLQTLFEQPKTAKYPLLKKVLKKLSKLHAASKKGHDVNKQLVLYRKEFNVIKDYVLAELNIYQDIIRSTVELEFTKSHINANEKKFSIGNQEYQLIIDTLQLIDQLIVSMLTAKRLGLYEDRRTFFYQKNLLRQRLYQVMGRLNQLSV